MSKIEEIEAAIEGLPPDDFIRLREWVQRRFDDQWDLQFEADVAAGRLNRLANQAISEHRSGRSTPFPPNGK